MEQKFSSEESNIYDKQLEEIRGKLNDAIMDIRLIVKEQHQLNQKLHEHDEHLIRIENQNNALFEIAGSMKEMKVNQELFHKETKEEIKEIKVNVNDKMDEVLNRVDKNEEIIKSYDMKGFNRFKSFSSKTIDSIGSFVGGVIALGIVYLIFKMLEIYFQK